MGGALAAAACGCRSPQAAEKSGNILFGACLGTLEDVTLMKNAGYDFWEWSVAAAFDPTKDDEWWKRQRDEIARRPLPLRSCNGFIPGRFRLTGPKADPAPALDYAETALRRADELGVACIVFGSGGARNVPGDFCGGNPPDLEKGVRQYADFCRELGKRTADLKTVRVVVEPLRPNESNIVNFVWQGLDICRSVGSPRIAALADVFHMMMGGEGPLVLSSADAVRWLRHVHVAEYGSRLFPGHDEALNDRLRPYFRELVALSRRRPDDGSFGISCECGWGDASARAKNLEISLKTMKEML